MESFVYFLDMFIPVDLTPKEVADSFKEDELKPFELVGEIVERELEGIRSVELLGSFSRKDELLIEYLVNFSGGQLTVKILCSDSPRKLLIDYYQKITST